MCVRLHSPLALPQKRTRTFLIVTTVIFSLGGLLGILPAITSVFLFDSPGSEKNPATIILFANALTFPLACLTSVVVSWVLYAAKRYTLAVVLAFLPLVNVIMGAGALVWLELFNDGRFS
jgi:hypothetical protein